MTFTKTTNHRTNRTRYFVDGKRVSRDRYEGLKFWKRLNCFFTETNEKYTRQHCAG
jgi:hypothetical protein